jgi:hypothetical protein
MTQLETEARELEAIADIINNVDVSDELEDIDPEELAYNLRNDDDFFSLLQAEAELGLTF